MGRLLAAAAIAATLLGGAGCSSNGTRVAGSASPGAAAGTPGTPATAQPGGTATSPGAVTGAAGGNATDVCVAATKASSQSAQAFIDELGRMLAAAGTSDTKAAETAKGKAEGVLAAWAAAMKEQSSRATDARLKAVLADVGAQVGAMTADINSVDQAKLDQLQQRLDQLCGR
jgi:ElaB/YqjD/DUF883 family membrane-anchored ribosome-binding protein